MKHLTRLGLLAACTMLVLSGCGKKVKDDAAKKTKADVTAVNGSARAISIAVRSAVTDFLAEDTNLALLNGDYVCKGSDFALAGNSPDNPKDTLKARVKFYSPDIENLAQVSFRVENGSCIYVAVLDANGMYGTYPTAMNADDLELIDSMGEAADYAKNGMNSRIQ